MELLNRRHIMFAVVGAAGLALAVDKLVLSDGLSSPSKAAASEVPAKSATSEPGKEARKSSDGKGQLSPASRLSVYRKSSQASLAGDAGLGAGTPRDAMAYPSWVPSETSMPAAGSHGDVAAGQFVLSGIASNSVRLRRQGDPQDMDRGRILKLGEQVVWSPKVGVTVRLVSIAHDEQSAVIEVDGDARQVRLAIGGDGAEGLKPGSKIRVERAPETPEKP